IPSEVVPRPSVEAAFFDVGDVVGDEVVPEIVTLVRADPQLTGRRIDGEPGRVPDASGVDASAGAVDIELEHRRAILFGRWRIGIVHIRTRANSDPHLLAVRREHEVAGRMASAGER